MRIACSFFVCLLCSWCQLTVTTQAVDKVPLRVYVLAGQSNMQGHAQVRTMEAMRLNPQAAPLLKLLRQPDGTPRICQRVWISSIGSADTEQTGRVTVGFGAQGGGPKIGPEFAFGITLEEQLPGPCLLIKTAWGGKSLHTDFRSPSSGAYEFNAQELQKLAQQQKDVQQLTAERKAASGHYYRLMMEHVKTVLADISRVVPEYDPQAGYELAGFVWFQGWNDMVDAGVYPQRGQPGGYDLYSQLLANFIRDVRHDLQAPELPFVIGVMGVGGPTTLYSESQQRYQSIHQGFRDAMAAPAALPEFAGNVHVVLTEQFWDSECSRLRERESQLKPELDKLRKSIAGGEVSKAAGEAAIEALYTAQFNPRELEILRTSTSNAEFHYLGSAGIMTQIGQAFAQALLAHDKQ